MTSMTPQDLTLALDQDPIASPAGIAATIRTIASR
jgi:hypothetical protein